MTKNLILFIIFFQCCTAYGQDVLLLVDGTEIKCKIWEITLSEVSYSKLADSTGNAFGDTNTIEKSKVFLVKYANGTKEVFSENLAEENENELLNSEENSEEMYRLGVEHARKYYNSKEIFNLSLLSGAVLNVYTVIPYFVVANKAPKIVPEDIPEQSYPDNKSYERGYKYEATKIRDKKMTEGMAIGCVGSTVVSFLPALLFLFI